MARISDIWEIEYSPSKPIDFGGYPTITEFRWWLYNLED